MVKHHLKLEMCGIKHNFTSVCPMAACVNANIFHLQVNIHTPLEKVVTCHFNSANSHSSSKFAQVFKHRQYKRWTLPLWRHLLVLDSTVSTFDVIRHICFSSLNVPYIIQQAITLIRWTIKNSPSASDSTSFLFGTTIQQCSQLHYLSIWIVQEVQLTQSR